MPTILKPGKPEEELYPYTTVFACQACGCEFRLTPGDKYHETDGDWRDPGTIYTACPNCGYRCSPKRK